MVLRQDQPEMKQPTRAFLVGAYGNRLTRDVGLEQLEELRALGETYGVETVGKELCLLRKFDPSTFVGSGKVDELITRVQEVGADLVIFDDEITPAQQRNLEKLFKLPVMDRTEVILGVFGQRAQTKEACLQIELARTKYMAPRLKRLWTHLSRQAATGGGGAGGGAYLKGEGEKQIEIDRRLVKKRMERLEQQIEQVRGHRITQRSSRSRSGIPVFAIVGYTNAGKSTLLNALTEAETFVEDKLFATLDTTTRKMTLRNGQEILLIDTVGFIRKLPHLLVAAFRATLEESLEADILLHIIDASHPMALAQASTTFEVLKELGVEDKPVITVLNKTDRCQNLEIADRLRVAYPKTVQISALKHEGFDQLEELMIEELGRRRQRLKLRIPQKDYLIVSQIMQQGHVLKRDYDENDVRLIVELPAALAGRLTPYIEKE